MNQDMIESKELFSSVWRDVELMRYLCEPRGHVYSRTQAACDIFDRMASSGQLWMTEDPDIQDKSQGRGFVSTYSEFALRWNWSWRQAKDFIDGLEKLGFLYVEKMEKKQLYSVRPYMISFPFLSVENLFEIAVFSLENPAVSVERTAAYFDEYYHMLEKKIGTGKSAKNTMDIHRTRTILQLMFGALSGFGCGYLMRATVVPPISDNQLPERLLVSFDGKACWNWKKWVLVLRKMNEELSMTQDREAVRFVDLTLNEREEKLKSWLPFLREEEIVQVAELTQMAV